MAEIRVEVNRAVCGKCGESNAIVSTEKYEAIRAPAQKQAGEIPITKILVNQILKPDGREEEAYLAIGSRQGFNCGNCGHANVLRQPPETGELN